MLKIGKSSFFIELVLYHSKKDTLVQNEGVIRGPAGLFRDVEFATFWDGILGNWVLKLRETGLDTPTRKCLNFSTRQAGKIWKDSVISRQIILARSNKTHTWFVLREIEIQPPLQGPYYILEQYFRELLNYYRFEYDSQSRTKYSAGWRGRKIRDREIRKILTGFRDMADFSTGIGI